MGNNLKNQHYKNMGIKTANVETGTVSNTIVGTGTLELDVSEETLRVP